MDTTEELINMLISKNLKIVTCESCTAGSLVSTLTDIEGSSQVVTGGYVTYTNEQKINVGVPKEIINKYGVYSVECAEAMAKAVMNNTNCNIAVGVTGNFSNIDPENKEGVPGTIFYAIMFKDKGNADIYVIDLEQSILKKNRRAQKEWVCKEIINKLNNMVFMAL